MKNRSILNLFYLCFMAIIVMFSACEDPKNGKGPGVTVEDLNLMQPEDCKNLSARYVDRMNVIENLVKRLSHQELRKELEISEDEYNVLRDISNTSHIYFSLDELEDFIQYSKDRAKEKPYALDGFNFYWGIFPNDVNEIKSWPAQIKDRREYTSRLTMFMVPATFEVRNGAFSFSPAPPPPPRSVEGESGLEFGSTGNPPTSIYPE